jgi:hypothetical protein
MAVNLIDVWNVETFDEDLIATLRANSELVRNYIETDREIFLEREASGLRVPYRTNPHAESYGRFLEDLDPLMKTRTIRAWHYTRLTDTEVIALRTAGIYVSTLDATRRRPHARVAAGELPADIAKALFAASPFQHREQVASRSNKFWITSHPVEIGNRGVTLLLGNWGGEAVYFWLHDPELKEVVASIGKSRVVEVGVPLDATCRAYLAGKAVVAAFARSLGLEPDFREFDLYTTRALGPDAVLAVHTEGEAAFAEIGKGYPITFSRAVCSILDQICFQ